MSQSTSRLNGPAYTANTQSSCQRYRSTSQRRHFSISQTADISSGPMRTRTPNSRGYNAIAIPDASNCPRRSGPLPSSTFITAPPGQCQPSPAANTPSTSPTLCPHPSSDLHSPTPHQIAPPHATQPRGHGSSSPTDLRNGASSALPPPTPAHAPSQSASSLHAPQPESPSTDAHDHAFLPLQRSFDAPVRFFPPPPPHKIPPPPPPPPPPPTNTRRQKKTDPKSGNAANRKAKGGFFSLFKANPGGNFLARDVGENRT